MTRPQSIERIREALEAGPTSGPWMVTKGLNGPYAVICTETGPRIDIASTYSMPSENFTNARFVAACNPSAIKELLTYLEGVERALEEIAAIENKMFGPDWEEIDQAREIARAAIAKEPKP